MTATVSATLVGATGVTCRFGSFTAVDDVTLAVGPGEIVGLIGANGAGKTTLIRMLLGLLRPSAGSVELFGATPSRRQRRRLGYVPQGLGLYRDMTVDENLRFSAAAFGASPDELLPADLRAARHRLVSDIGLGLQRRLAFVAALGHAPSLLVLDEPTSGVDPLARARLWDLIHQQVASGTGVLVTTHYMQEADQCDRLVIMAAGRVVAEGTTGAIIGDRRAVVVQSEDWQVTFNTLADRGLAVGLAGRDVRVAGTDSGEVHRVLGSLAEHASITEEPATLDETMVLISRST